MCGGGGLCVGSLNFVSVCVYVCVVYVYMGAMLVERILVGNWEI